MSENPASSSPVVVRPATETDAGAIAVVESAARTLLEAHGVDVTTLHVPEGVEAPISWSLAFVAEVGRTVVGVARLSELDDDVVCLDQVSTAPEFAGRGVGRQLLEEVASACRKLGYSAITGTTFRDVAFNAPFYASMGCVEDPQPHPAMARRRHVERELGLDQLGPRLVMRLPLSGYSRVHHPRLND